MSTELKIEFIELLSNNTAELIIKERETRGVDIICQLFATAISIGAFSGLWKVIELWVKRYANAKVKVTYTAVDGSVVEVEYSNLTKAEAEQTVQKHPIRIEDDIKIVVFQ